MRINSKNRSDIKILLIDEDEYYGSVMSTKAVGCDIDLDYYSSLEKLGKVSLFSDYDVIIFDYWMKCLNGKELAIYVKSFCPSIPVIIISSDQRLLLDRDFSWPENIRIMLSKDTAPMKILRKAQELVLNY